MRHAWLLLLVGCSSSNPPHEPQMGTATVQYGSAMGAMKVGAAILDPMTAGNMIVELGSDNVDCTVNLDFEPEENYGGNRYPPMVIPEKQDWDMVDKRWKEYGFKK